MRVIDRLIPTSYHEAQSMLGSKTSKRLNANTELVLIEPYRIGLKLHRTVVVEYHPGNMQLNTGGWQTTTTKARINAALRNTRARVYQRDHEWFIDLPNADYSVTQTEFTDGMVVAA